MAACVSGSRLSRSTSAFTVCSNVLNIAGASAVEISSAMNSMSKAVSFAISGKEVCPDLNISNCIATQTWQCLFVFTHLDRKLFRVASFLHPETPSHTSPAPRAPNAAHSPLADPCRPPSPVLEPRTASQKNLQQQVECSHNLKTSDRESTAASSPSATPAQATTSSRQ